MHGLINRSIQNYVCDTYGSELWTGATLAAGLEFTDFEAMLCYDDGLTPRVLDAVAQILGHGRDEVMEDIGTYLVSHPSTDAVRRLLRFGGVTFEEFLLSLGDLRDRARLAVAELDLPRIDLVERSDGLFSLSCEAPITGFGNLLMGVMRGMADDYGALVMLEHLGTRGTREEISITLISAEFAEGRRFDLGAGAR